jgi:hypothetical protein
VIVEEDVSYTAAGLDPDSCAVIVLWEDLWAAEFVLALRTVGGSFLEGARVPAESEDSEPVARARRRGRTHILGA